MANYVSNCQISGPNNVGWKATWDLSGMGWSHQWGMFYPVGDDDDRFLPFRGPSNVDG